MFENKSYEDIIDEMLDKIDSSIDTRQGSVIYDAIAPVAVELEQIYSDIGLVEDECFADTASYYYLIKRAAERGIFVKQGQHAVLKVKITPSDKEIQAGTGFNIGELNYEITENLGEGYYSLTCTETGKGGNNSSDDVIPIEDVEGLESIAVVEIMTYGTDDEDEESLRERYFDSFAQSSFGGNKAEYKEKANQFDVVGGCKVIPVWNGGGTVKLVILGADFGVAQRETVQYIQEAFDPQMDGTGIGIAPIGHTVTVVSAETQTVDIACTLIFQNGYKWEDIQERIAASIDGYFQSLRKTWEDTENIVVRAGQIENILLDLDGIMDVAEIKLNNDAGNVIIDTYKIPEVGEVVGQTDD
ncbi:MAG: baseplate J/gp47 family protein [Eubacterium sp.]|nr:baseplate J/gp47 family protein [Eubacterium sp.]